MNADAQMTRPAPDPDGRGYADRLLAPEEMAAICDRAFGGEAYRGKRLLVVVPDHSRTCPLDTVFRLLYERLAPRVEVILATRIPEEVCRRVNLGYMDPATISPRDYQDREDEGILYVPKAGEILYRLENAPPELGGSTP